MWRYGPSIQIMLVNMIEKSIAIFQAFVALISEFELVKSIHICSDSGEIKRLHQERTQRNRLTHYLFEYSQSLINVFLHLYLTCENMSHNALLIDNKRVSAWEETKPLD